MSSQVKAYIFNNQSPKTVCDKNQGSLRLCFDRNQYVKKTVDWDISSWFTFSPRRSSISEFNRSSELLEIKSRLFQNASRVGSSSYSKVKMRAFEICEARSLSGQKVEFSAEVHSFWSTFKPGTKTILCFSQLSVNVRFMKNTWLSYSTLASEGSLMVLIDILKNLEIWTWF